MKFGFQFVFSILILGFIPLSDSLSIKNNKWKNSRPACPDPYSKCDLGKDGMINVHLVPHTHDDVGWLKTVDQYYYGSNTTQQKAGVQYILDSVIRELELDPIKRFVYVEIAYFWRWWRAQTSEKKDIVRQLVGERRLEFVIGAWCMNDEASTYYQDIIDQQTLGLQFILKEFGECARPRTAWQVDPFGHSREQASLFAQFGFDGLFQGRIDYQDKDYRGKSLTREMVWQASSSLGDKAKIFTGILPNTYGPPSGFCFDIFCNDDPIMDDPLLDGYNVDQKVDAFISAALSEADVYATQNLIMTMGEDFQFSNAHMWYKNLDKLISYVNQRQLNGSKINIFYSTPACYLYSLYKINQTWPTKSDDFFPYASRPHTFWTGYFSSRTTLKQYVRQANSFLQALRHTVLIFDFYDDATKDSLAVLSRALAVAQHHDAISGTERQYVAYDYAKRLSIGMTKCVDILQKGFGNILGHHDTIIYCSQLNITECVGIQNVDSILVYVYNPLGRFTDLWIRVPVSTADYTVYSVVTGENVTVDFVPVTNETLRLPDRKSGAFYDALFKATLPPVSYFAFTLTKNSEASRNRKPVLIQKQLENFSVSNQHLSMEFDASGNLLEISNLNQNLKTSLGQSYCFYKSMVGDNMDPNSQSSGAYIFRPNGTAVCFKVNRYDILSGQNVQEVRQIYNDWISQTIRLYDDAQYAEFEWQIGPIDVEDHVGKEVIVKFASDLNSDSTFYTDANGREVLKRVRDFRPSWPHFNQTESIAGNYYPVNSRIFIKDEHLSSRNDVARQLTLVTDRTHGASSIEDGSIEIMFHRRILHDDKLGVAEPLNEPGSDNNGLIARGKFYVIFNSTQNSVRLHRELAHAVNTQPLMFFVANPTSEIKKSVNFALSDDEFLPQNVHLLTLMYDFDNDRGNSFIVRLEHFYEVNEDPVLSQPATLDLINLFGRNKNIVYIEELALGANMEVDELDKRLKFNTKSNQNKTENDLKSEYDIVLNPMEIKTFRLWFLPDS